MVVELDATNDQTGDIEVFNNSDSRAFVQIEAREILAPGDRNEVERRVSNPAELGLLATPSKLILEPRQRRLVRLFATDVAPRSNERVYRLMVKPVVGKIESEASGLMVLVGYDLLILARPEDVQINVVGTRQGGTLSIHNRGNASVELEAGQQCQNKASCADLPGKRLYAGASWEVTVPAAREVSYIAKVGKKAVTLKF